ncbi:MFS transporter [Blastopirellula sp. JC732]|uniref:MFS transporter n=1 Tax=Blastopirellula sediminis TaxID=2894196 RepID=A0A9X1SIZ5_9BACT|nr:MFS transporter [Blastopirellula sediminis]MCC9604903.1 MFS transporter [Blastopirellula sediminis]MCC9631797.1 MFS transporter [Blastopirellula sediminis]
MDKSLEGFESPQTSELRIEDPTHLPPLSRDVSFWGMTITQFFGAFNDNVFKQLLLLMGVAQAVDGTGQDLQGIAMIIFSLPFLLLAGPAGYLADKYSKTNVIVLSKVAEIVAMLLGVIGFWYFGMFGFAGLFVVLFLMGAQSTFFGPAKYGILPEMLHEHDLPKANGIFLMTTFLAIIFGTVAAGVLRDQLTGDGAESNNQLWIGSAICVVIAIVGTLTSLLVRKTEPAKPNAKLTVGACTIPPSAIKLFRARPPMLKALLASCIFWLCAGIVQQSVNSLGVVQLKLNDTETSIMNGLIGVGIACGCLLAGLLSKGQINFRIVQTGAWGISASLALLALPGPNHGHLLGYWGSLPVLVVLGACTGMFSVPIQVYLQAKAPLSQKGEVIAEMSRANWVAILLSGVLYGVFDKILLSFEWPRCYLFAFTVLIMLPVAILYHPPSEDLE